MSDASTWTDGKEIDFGKALHTFEMEKKMFIEEQKRQENNIQFWREKVDSLI